MPMDAFSERLTKLERLTKGIFVLLVFAIAFLSVTLYRLSSLEALSIQRFEVVDGKGRAIIVLSRNPFGQPVFTMHDAMDESDLAFPLTLMETLWLLSLARMVASSLKWDDEKGHQWSKLSVYAPYPLRH